MSRKYFKNNNVIFNQLRSKLLLTNLYEKPKVDSVYVTSNFHKLKSFNDDLILEGLFLVEFFTSMKSNITYFKRMYQEVNLQVAGISRGNYLFYFLILLKMFYFPILIRRNLYVPASFDSASNYTFIIDNVNIMSFLPDIYFKWDVPLNCFIRFDNSDLNTSKLLLSYWNFPIRSKNV